jgi:hypothetical protein
MIARITEAFRCFFPGSSDGWSCDCLICATALMEWREPRSVQTEKSLQFADYTSPVFKALTIIPFGR